MRLLLSLCLALLAGCRPPLEEVFSVPTDAPSRAGVAVDPGGLLVVNDSGRVLRLSLQGAPLWTAELGRPLAARPAVADGVAVVASIGGDWVGLGLDDGKERWHLVDQPDVDLPLATDGTRVFLAAADGSLTAVLAASGAIAWKWLSSDGPRRPPAPVVTAGQVVAAFGDSQLAALDLATGEPRWKAPLPGALGLCADEARVYALAKQRLIALNLATGKQSWSRPLAAAPTGPPSLARGAVWLGLAPSAVAQFAVADGVERKALTLTSALVTSVTEAGPFVLVPQSGPEGSLLLLRPEGPAHRQRVNTPLRTPVAEASGLWVLAPIDGRLLVYRPRSSGW